MTVWVPQWCRWCIKSEWELENKPVFCNVPFKAAYLLRQGEISSQQGGAKWQSKNQSELRLQLHSATSSCHAFWSDRDFLEIEARIHLMQYTFEWLVHSRTAGLLQWSPTIVFSERRKVWVLKKMNRWSTSNCVSSWELIHFRTYTSDFIKLIKITTTSD